MRILMMRHGECEGNENPAAFVRHGDSKNPLTSKGWNQAERAGEFLADYYASTNTTSWPVIFTSPSLRPLQTLRGAAEALVAHFGTEPKIFEDTRLIEQYFGAMAAVKTKKFKGVMGYAGELLMRWAEALHARDPFTTPLPFGNSVAQTVNTTKIFIDGPLARDIAEGKDDFLISAHGAIIKAIMMNWFHLPMDSWKQIKTPGNTDIFCIEGAPKNWSITQIYDGEKGCDANINPIAGITHLTYGTLPKRHAT